MTNQCLSWQYLIKLKEEKQQLEGLVMGGVMLTNSLRLLEEEIIQVEKNQRETETPDKVVTLSEKVLIPKDSKLQSRGSLIGRILGPGGATIRRLELRLCCTLRVRGQGSCRDKCEEGKRKGQTGWEHLEEELHVKVTTEGPESMVRQRLDWAVYIVKGLLHPAEDKDQLKRSQLAELAIQKGKYNIQSGQSLTCKPPDLLSPPPILPDQHCFLSGIQSPPIIRSPYFNTIKDQPISLFPSPAQISDRPPSLYIWPQLIPEQSLNYTSLNFLPDKSQGLLSIPTSFEISQGLLPGPPLTSNIVYPQSFGQMSTCGPVIKQFSGQERFHPFRRL